MSNIKQVLVSGHVPFNLADHPSLARKLAFFNTPTSGLKIAYGAQYEMRQNAHGGQTAMYPFCLQGQEAVSASYIQSFINDVYAVGGKVTGTTVTDIENNETCKVDFKKIQFPMVPNFGERPDASGQMLAALKGIECHLAAYVGADRWDGHMVQAMRAIQDAIKTAEAQERVI